MNNAICSKVWTDVYVTSPTHMAPCCRSWSVEANTIEEYWAHPRIQELRDDMLAGIANVRCEFCYVQEARGFTSIRDFISPFNSQATQIDLQNAEVRFSNICNFKCRTCNGSSSSALALEEVDQHPIKYALGDDTQLLNEIKAHTNTLQSIKFSGGEPLLHWQHWDLLETLIKSGNAPNITLKYNSNCSILSYKRKSVIEMWKNFKHVEFIASLDASGAKAEYWRSGTVWSNVVKNLHELLDQPNVHLGVHVTVSWVNALSIVEHTNNLISLGIPHTAISYSPSMNVFSVQSAPVKLKLLISQELLKISSKDAQVITDYMLQHYSPRAFESDIERLKKIDKLRNESFVAVFPEHKAYYHE